jgi:FeS assembly protein IscX
MRLNNIDNIADSLQEHYPDEDVLSLQLTEIYDLLMEIESFSEGIAMMEIDDEILEKIQDAWIKLRDEEGIDD